MTKSICYHGFLGGAWSMGRVAYYLFTYLNKHPGYEAYFLPSRGDSMFGRWDEAITARITTASKAAFDQSIRFSSVREARPPDLAKLNSTWLFYELNSLPKEIVRDINANDLVYATSTFVKNVFVAAKVTVPVQVMGHGFDPAFYTFKPRKKDRPFHFLCVAEHTPRKNLPLLIQCFEKAFPSSDDVCLTLKVGAHGTRGLRKYIKRPQRVRLWQGTLEEERQLAALYYYAHCFVLPTRGEGFGMPMLEAMATGLPVIVTDYGGHLDFCNDANSFLIHNRGLVDSDPACFPNVRSQWADPDADHLIHLMREVYENYDRALAKAKLAYTSVKNKWTWKAQLGKVFP